MSDYIFISDEKNEEFLVKVSAENIEKAKNKYAEKLWEIDDFEQKQFKSKVIDVTFWRKYSLDLVSNKDGSWIHEIDETKKLFKANLEKDFSPQIAEELHNYFFNREESIEKLTDKARVDVAKVQVQNLLDDNFLRIYSLNEMRSIS